MPKLIYDTWKPTGASVDIVNKAAIVCNEYAADGYDLTLRQLFYQFVSRGWLGNTHRNYKNLGETINKARMAGLIDWNHIADRTRSLYGTRHYEDAAESIQSAADMFAIDRWEDQPTRVEVWVEKEALAGVIGRVAGRWDIDYFPCKGYVSQSEQWRAGRRFHRYLEGSYDNPQQNVVILHLGDHDPSGIDMTRDITDRLRNFIMFDSARAGLDRDAIVSRLGRFEVRRIALNMDQIEEYDPPPNPAKLTDSRSNAYVDEYGYESWELDALDPRTLDALIEEHVEAIIDQDLFDEATRKQEAIRDTMRQLTERDWDDVTDWLEATS